MAILGTYSIFSVVYKSFTEQRKTNDICTYNYHFPMRTTFDVNDPLCKLSLMLKAEDEAASFGEFY